MDDERRNDQAAIRLVGALLAEKSDDWQERAFFDMDEYHEWKSATVLEPPAAQKAKKAA